MSSPRVYFLTDGHAIKIGYSENIEHRRRELQVGNWKELTLVGWVPAGDFEEVGLHAQFAHLRIRGEWFNPGADLLEFITENVHREPKREILDVVENAAPAANPELARAAADFMRWANSQEFESSSVIHGASWVGSCMHRLSIYPTPENKAELARALRNFEAARADPHVRWDHTTNPPRAIRPEPTAYVSSVS